MCEDGGFVTRKGRASDVASMAAGCAALMTKCVGSACQIGVCLVFQIG